jgi:predicted dehydrogenase
MIGYAFMGKTHSNAWRNVASFFDVPAFEQKVLVGRDATQVAEAAARYGREESATDWRAVLDRDDIDIVDICAPGGMHAEKAIGGAFGTFLMRQYFLLAQRYVVEGITAGSFR